MYASSDIKIIGEVILMAESKHFEWLNQVEVTKGDPIEGCGWFGLCTLGDICPGEFCCFGDDGGGGGCSIQLGQEPMVEPEAVTPG